VEKKSEGGREVAGEVASGCLEFIGERRKVSPAPSASFAVRIGVFT
jgi:hypothetical protein